MRILHSQLSKLTVRTEGGTELGKVTDVTYDATSHSIVRYAVSSGMLRHTRYDIAPSQVVSMTESEMIVSDTVTPIVAEETARHSIPSAASPAMMTESD